MTFAIQARPKLAAIAAACLLTVVLPSDAAMAQKLKNKTPAAEVTASVLPKTEVSVEIPTIEAVGSSVDDATLRAIFSGDIVDHAQALADLDATSITIPSITLHLSSKAGDIDSGGDLTFKNLVLDNVAGGVAGAVSLGGMALTSTEDIAADFGAVSAKNLDIGGVLGMYGLVTPGNQTELRTIYSDFAAAGGTFTAENMNCAIGTTAIADFKARPLKTNFADIMALSKSFEAEGETPSPETIGQILRLYADIFTAFESTPTTFGGFNCKGTDDNDQPMDFSIAGMTMEGLSPGKYPALALKDLRVAVEGDSEVSVGNLVFKTMDLTGPIAAVAAAPTAIDEAWLTANMRSLIPAFGGFSFDNVTLDVPNPDKPSERIAAKVGAFDLSLGNYRNGIPTDISTVAKNIVVDLPSDSDDEQMQQLLDLGITSLDLGFALKTTWDEAADAINVEDISINGANLASFALAGTIGNATETLFDSNPDNAFIAAMGLVINNLKVNVVDAGLGDIAIARAAADQGSDAATMRPIFAGLAEGTIIGMFAGAAEGQQVGKAVSSFIRGEAKSLSLEMTPKEPAGLGLMDFLSASDDPTVLIGKTNITAVAK